MSQTRKHKVYAHITPDDRIYIGLTGQEADKRWLRGKGYWGQWFYRCGISVFGWDNIEHLIVANNLTSEEAVTLEQQLIVRFHTYDPNIGFNDRICGRCSIRPVRWVNKNCVFPTAEKCADYMGTSFNKSGIYEACCRQGEYKGQSFRFVMLGDGCGRDIYPADNVNITIPTCHTAISELAKHVECRNRG